MAKKKQAAPEASAGERRDEPAFSLAPEGPQEEKEKKIERAPEKGEPFFISKAREAVSLLLENLQDPERLDKLSARETLDLARELMKEIRLQEEHEKGGPGEEEEGTRAEELSALDKRLRKELKGKGYL